jgi:hypothetical protein
VLLRLAIVSSVSYQRSSVPAFLRRAAGHPVHGGCVTTSDRQERSWNVGEAPEVVDAANHLASVR